tara:strand:- start:451 stop:1668 length:1218 start_codon:yes stop_codon:yes gene_type:complete
MYSWYNFVGRTLNDGILSFEFGYHTIWHLMLIPLAYVYDWLTITFQISAIPVSVLPSNFDPSYGITVIPDPIFNLLIKIPLIVADILSAFLIFKIAYFYTRDYFVAKRSMLLYFFSPIVIWISAAWGQYDSLAVFFTLLSLYFLLVQKKIGISSAVLMIAVLIKIYPVIFFIPIIISMLRFESYSRWKLVSFLSLPIILGLYIIFFQDVFRFFKFLFFPEYFFFTSGFGLTYWSIALIIPPDILLSRLIVTVATLSFVAISLYYVIRRAKTQFDVIIFGSFLFTASFFLSLQIVSEQRSLILLAFLSLIIIKQPSLNKYFYIFSFAAFLYAQKNFPFYLLPIASRFPDSFSSIFSFFTPLIVRTSDFIAPTFYGSLVLSIIGVSFSCILFFLVLKILKINNVFLN